MCSADTALFDMTVDKSWCQIQSAVDNNTRGIQQKALNSS